MKLTAKARRAIPKSDFAIPEKAPGSGSFPVEDRTHAANALSRSANQAPAVRARVRAKVHAKYPNMGKS